MIPYQALQNKYTQDFRNVKPWLDSYIGASSRNHSLIVYAVILTKLSTMSIVFKNFQRITKHFLFRDYVVIITQSSHSVNKNSVSNCNEQSDTLEI